MKKLSLFSCFALINICIGLLLNLSELKAQTDIIDKCTASIYDCVSGTVEITYNLDGCGANSSIVLQNVSGYRTIEEPSTGDKVYKFCAANSFAPCSDTHIDGEFQIIFRHNSSDITVNKVNFIILGATNLTIYVYAYQGSIPVPITGTTATGGLLYTYDSGTPCNYIKVVSKYDGGLDPALNAFGLNDLHVLTGTAPTDIALVPYGVDENLPVNTVVGALTTTDPDVCDSHNYSLVSGSGSTDNASFNISGSNLRTSLIFDYETKSTYSVRIQTDDGHGGTFAKAFTININNVAENNPPTDISLSPTSVNENQPVNTVVGALTSTDPDAGDSHTYSLVSGSGSTDNASFNISGSNLRTSLIFDYETKSTYSVRIQTDDGHGGTFAKAFTININNIAENNPPTDISLSPASVNENQPVNTVVGALTSTDPDAGDSHTYSLVSGSGSTDNASFNISGSNLRTSLIFDYETKSTYSVRIQTDDGHGGTFAKAFTININNVAENNPPTDISLSPASVNENQPVNTVVGALTSTDPDAGDSHTYSLVSGSGSTDNASFNISGSNLRTSLIFDYETKSTYSVRIQTDDGHGGTFAKAININIIDLPDEPPEVVCLLDISGSMQRDFFGTYGMPQNQWRISYAKNALEAFAEVLYSNFAGTTSYGLASFKSPAGTCQGFINYNMNTLYESNYINDILPVINTLNAEGGTPLLAGLETARSMFQTSDLNEKKVIILLSDGAHNCPYLTDITNNPVYTNLMNQIIAKKIKVYTIAFGQSGEVDPVLLSDIASKTFGEFYDVTNNTDPNIKAVLDPGTTLADVWDAGNALDIAYSHVFNNSLGLSYMADPMGLIHKGTSKQFDVAVSGFENKITLFISWVKPQQDYLGIKITTSNGTELPANNPDVKYIHRGNYTIITVSDNYLKRPGVTGSNPWKLKIDASNIDTESEKFQFLAFNQSGKLNFKVWFDKNWYYTGDKMKIYLEILNENKNIINLDKVSINGSMPKEGLGNLLAGTRVTLTQLEELKRTELEKITRIAKEQAGKMKLDSLKKQKLLDESINNQLDIMTFNWLKTMLLSKESKNMFASRLNIDGLKFNDEGKNGDEKAGDGIYTASYLPVKEGSYRFNFSAIDISKGKDIHREGQLQKYVKVRISPKSFIKDIRLIEKLKNGDLIYNLVLNLRDKYGNIPAPTALGNALLSIDKGTLIDGIVANPDGTFTQKVSLPPNIKPKDVTMTMKIDDLSGSQKLASHTLRWILGIIVIILIGGAFIKRKRK